MKVPKPTTPRVVVIKEVVTPTKKAAAANAGNKTNSLMITKLWSGLSKEEVMEYFERFGKIVTCSMTDAANQMADGYKYMFLKFSDATAVDKALGELT